MYRCEQLEGFHLCDEGPDIERVYELCPQTCDACGPKKDPASQKCREEVLPRIPEYRKVVTDRVLVNKLNGTHAVYTIRLFGTRSS